MRTLSPAVALGLLVALTTGCDQEPPGETLEVTSPTEGAVLSVPFEVTIDSSAPLGPPTLGLHHVHIWFGGDADSYQVVEQEVTEVTSAPAGQQVMHVSLRRDDHSAAGAEASVSVVISGGTSD